MATFKAEVQSKRRDGTYNIKIRITHNRQKKYIATNLYVTDKELTRSLKIKDQSFKDAAEDIIKRYREICNIHSTRLDDFSVEQIVELIKSKHNGENKFELDFVGYGRRFAENLINTGHESNGKVYITALNALVKFAGRDVIYIEEITTKFINAFTEWIQTRPVTTKRVRGDRAVSHYLASIRSLHNKAKVEFNNEDIGIINIPFSPFSKIKVPKPPLTRKRALTIEQIQAIIDLPYNPRKGCEPGEFVRFNLAKDVFLLSFGLIGINSVDLFNCTCLKDDRLTYERTKTRTRRQDRAEISIKIEPEISKLVDKYRDKSGKRVFNFYQHYSNRVTFNANINKPLKDIGKAIGIDDLEFYAARHSWATIALNNAGVDKHTVHSALNHVDETMRVTDIYIKKDNVLQDTANRKVLDKFDFSEFSVDES